MRTLKLLTTLLIAPVVVAAQEPFEGHPGQREALAALTQLDGKISSELADKIRSIVTDATNRGLPGLAIANQALMGVAKGRSGEEVLAAAQELAGNLAGARDAFAAAGRVPDRSEIEAGATAMGLGVDGETIAHVASTTERSGPLAVAIAVLGALAYAGVPVDIASAAVVNSLNDGADNTELVEMAGAAGRMIADGMRPSDVGLALASSITGMTLPAGPPANVPRADGPGANVPRNDGRPVQPPVQPPVLPPVPTP